MDFTGIPKVQVVFHVQLTVFLAAILQMDTVLVLVSLVTMVNSVVIPVATVRTFHVMIPMVTVYKDVMMDGTAPGVRPPVQYIVVVVLISKTTHVVRVKQDGMDHDVNLNVANFAKEIPSITSFIVRKSQEGVLMDAYRATKETFVT